MKNARTPEDVAHTVRQIASLPALHMRLLEMLGDAETSLLDLAPLIRNDPSLTARLLRLSNSSFYGRGGRVRTVVDALKVLGTNLVRSTILSTSIVEAFNRIPQKLLNMKDFWMHSVLVGAIARDLAALLGLPNPEEAQTAGLLHDVGRLAIVHAEPVEYHKLLLFSRSSGAWLTRLENQHLGYTHDHVGALLLESWGLPLDFIQVSEYHHRPQNMGHTNPLVWIIHLADALAHALEIGHGGEARIPAFEATAWDRLGLPGDELPVVLANAEQNVSELFEALLAPAEPSPEEDS